MPRGLLSPHRATKPPFIIHLFVSSPSPKGKSCLCSPDFIYFPLWREMAICSPNISQVSLETSAQRIRSFGGCRWIHCSTPSCHHILSSSRAARTSLWEITQRSGDAPPLLCDKSQQEAWNWMEKVGSANVLSPFGNSTRWSRLFDRSAGTSDPEKNCCKSRRRFEHCPVRSMRSSSK